MSKKQQIAEVERRFELWWNNEAVGCVLYNMEGSPKVEEVKALCKEAWLISTTIESRK